MKITAASADGDTDTLPQETLLHTRNRDTVPPRDRRMASVRRVCYKARPTVLHEHWRKRDTWKARKSRIKSLCLGPARCGLIYSRPALGPAHQHIRLPKPAHPSRLPPPPHPRQVRRPYPTRRNGLQHRDCVRLIGAPNRSSAAWISLRALPRERIAVAGDEATLAAFARSLSQGPAHSTHT